MSNPKNSIHTFNQWSTAFKEHNISKMVFLLTEDVKISSIMFGTHKGKDGASKYWQELYDAFPDIKINPITITTAANHERIVAEIDASGTQRGKVGGLVVLLHLVRNFTLEEHLYMSLWGIEFEKLGSIMIPVY